MVLPTLHNYQRYAAEYMKKRRYAGLFLDMGLGKTLVTLTALSEMGQAGQINGNILIIAPKTIAVNTWPSEIEKWDHTKNAPYTLLSGLSKVKREAVLKNIPDDKPRIYITNVEQITGLVEYYKDKWPFENVIIDEVQTFKSYSAKRFKALKSVRPYINRVYALTGTPAPSSLMDLWPQITILDGGARLGKNITQFREEHFNPGRRTPQGYPYEWWIKPGHEDLIFKQIDDIVISMRAVDHLDMPERVMNTVYVEMTKKEKAVYEQLKKDKVLPLIDGTEITSANAATLSAQLLQLANGAIYTDPETKDIAALHSHKIHALEQIRDSSQGQPLLVFYWFQHDVKRIVEYFGDEVTVFDGSPEMLERWNNGEIEVLLCHPSSHGFGINFQHGGHIIVWYALPNFNLGLYQQSNARLYRQGQKNTVIIHHIITKDTHDERVLPVLQEKEEQQDLLIDAVKAELGV